MDCFNYPIDEKYLVKKKRIIKKELLEGTNSWIEKKIAVLGGSTTNEIVDQLEIFLLNYGIKASFYQSEFGQYWSDAVFGSEELDSFEPDVIYIHTNWRNIKHFPDITDSKEDVDVLYKTEQSEFVQMWDKLAEKFGCPVVQNNFDRPDYRLMGNRDVWDYRGRSNFASRLNQMIYEYAQNHSGFYVNDLDYIAQCYGLDRWNNSLYWNMYKYAMPMDAAPYVAQSVANIIKSLFGKNKKAMVLDLDNTLWGGVIGDDGLEGIKIGPESQKGQVYADFQTYCKKLKETGVILAVDSKNDYDNAISGLKHPDGILRPEDFVAIKANWNPKDENIREIANELNLGADSFVFVDDNPAEREIVSVNVNGVAAPALDSAENYVHVIDKCGFFEMTNFSEEDMKKTEMYHAKAKAAEAAAGFANYDEYLEGLQMSAVIGEFEPLYYQRISQLTNKSNQFNLTTLRCSEDDIKSMQETDNYICLYGRLIDKFADNGIITVVAGEIIDKSLHMRLWLMSCRVLKRGMEDAVANVLVEEAKKRGIEEIVGYYYPTAKNGMVKELYGALGFDKVSEDDDGNSVWKCNIEGYADKKHHIVVKDR